MNLDPTKKKNSGFFTPLILDTLNSGVMKPTQTMHHDFPVKSIKTTIHLTSSSIPPKKWVLYTPQKNNIDTKNDGVAEGSGEGCLDVSGS